MLRQMIELEIVSLAQFPVQPYLEMSALNNINGIKVWDDWNKNYI